MIPIKIQGKSYRIKPIAELTTKEFIALCKIENLDIVKYIAWQTGVKMDTAFFAITSPAVNKAIGQVPDITKLPFPKTFNKSNVIETVGQRHQIEGCGLDGFELLVFVLAVAQAKSNNIDDVNKLRADYLDRPYTEILSAGFFFLQELKQWQTRRGELFKKASGIDKNAHIKKSAGIDKLNQYANDYELQTICELFPALTPDEALSGDDTFFTKHLLSNVEKCRFDRDYSELLTKQNRAKK